MLIEIIRNTVCGKKSVAKGDIVEASDQDAKLLIGMKKAVKSKKQKSKTQNK